MAMGDTVLFPAAEEEVALVSQCISGILSPIKIIVRSLGKRKTETNLHNNSLITFPAPNYFQLRGFPDMNKCGSWFFSNLQWITLPSAYTVSLYLSKPFASTTPVKTNSANLLHVLLRIRSFSLFWTGLWQLCLVLPSYCGRNDHVSHFLNPCSKSLTNLWTFIRCQLGIFFLG